METLQNKKECKNCIHYLAHYIKDNVHFRPMGSGHCLNKKPSGHFRKTDVICECFQERDLLKEKAEHTTSAVESLSYIAARINALIDIFTEINEKNETQKHT